MSRRQDHQYETNRRLARLEARLDRIDPTGPPRAAPLDMFTPELQARYLSEGRVYEGHVYN